MQVHMQYTRIVSRVLLYEVLQDVDHQQQYGSPTPRELDPLDYEEAIAGEACGVGAHPSGPKRQPPTRGMRGTPY